MAAIIIARTLASGEIINVEPGEAQWNLGVLNSLFDFYFTQPAVLKKKRDALNAKLREAGKPEMKAGPPTGVRLPQRAAFCAPGVQLTSNQDQSDTNTRSFSHVMEQLFSIDFLKFFLPLVGVTVAWFWNERRKRAADEYVRKEKKYEALVDSLRGFYTQAIGLPEGRELKGRFLQELNKCWLYCPDEVIKKAYAFMATVHTDKVHTDAEKEQAVGEFMVAIRRDLLSRRPVTATHLTASDFKHLRAT